MVMKIGIKRRIIEIRIRMKNIISRKNKAIISNHLIAPPTILPPVA
jgi:hypothetical protein